MSAVILYRVEPARNMHRFYRLDVQRDLFGLWLVVREWGRIGCRGQLRTSSFISAGEAYTVLDRHRRAKEKRGYALNAEPHQNDRARQPCRPVEFSRRLFQNSVAF
jgi:predicted DNA-binding WGR domain protein